MSAIHIMITPCHLFTCVCNSFNSPNNPVRKGLSHHTDEETGHREVEAQVSEPGRELAGCCACCPLPLGPCSHGPFLPDLDPTAGDFMGV